MKKEIIENIKELIKINPNYLEYFEVEELLDIQRQLELKKKDISKITNNYLDEIYQKTKKDEL